VKLDEEIYNEIINEMNEWFIQELEHEELYLIDLEKDNSIICPICQKCHLKTELGFTSNKFKCDCGVQ